MKKLLKCVVSIILIIALSIGALAVYMAIDKNNYKSCEAVVEFFEANKNELENYVDSNKQNIDENKEISAENISLQLNKTDENISVTAIQYNEGTIFFFLDYGWFYTGIYYNSKNEIVDPPYTFTDLPNDAQYSQVREGVYVNGEKWNGENWNMVEQLSDNWFYYEYHGA